MLLHSLEELESPLNRSCFEVIGFLPVPSNLEASELLHFLAEELCNV
jgi:hypothetical protein